MVAINSATQEPFARPLSAGRSLEREGPTVIDGGVWWTATVEPLELHSLSNASGLWLLHPGVMQHRSKVLALEIMG